MQLMAMRPPIEDSRVSFLNEIIERGLRTPLFLGGVTGDGGTAAAEQSELYVAGGYIDEFLTSCSRER